MLYSAAAVNRRLLTPLLSFVLCLFVIPTVQAASTQVNALVCGGATGASVSITSPASDSVVNQPTVTISGNVSNATQIDVSVDGAYNSTTPLDSQQTSYQLDVSLSEGTHTIKLVANDVCQTQDASASVVVTFQPQTDPGQGGHTPTSGGGISIGGQSSTLDNNGKQPLSSLPIVGPVVALLGWLGQALDFDTSADQGLERGILRFAFIIFGLLLFAFGSALIEFIIWLPFFRHRKIRRLRDMSHWRGWHEWALRLFGLVLFLAAFVI